jgi:alpha-beta hydrolase superfamily lysophospholipase
VLELRVARTTSDYDPDALLGETAADMLVHGEQLGEKPVVVLSAGAADSDAFPDPARARFTALHAQMAAVLSTKGEHRVIAGADHYTIVTQPDYAHRVAAAIQDVISSSTPEEP